ncbi:SPFH domain-containing protein, partial [Streptomyces sp. NPDC056290]
MSTHDTQVTADVPEMPAPRVREVPAHSIGGGLALVLGLAGLLVGAAMIVSATAVTATGAKAALIAGGILIAIAAFLAMCGLNMVAPGEARVVQLFGRYRGTIRQDGLRWVYPFTSRTQISTRVRNHETAVLK